MPAAVPAKHKDNQTTCPGRWHNVVHRGDGAGTEVAPCSVPRLDTVCLKQWRKCPFSSADGNASSSPNKKTQTEQTAQHQNLTHDTHSIFF